MINLNIYHREIETPSSLAPFALSNRAKLRQQFIQSIDKEITINSYQKIQTLHINEVTLQRIIEKYSEQAVYRPIDDMRYYFQYTKRAFIEPGYPPLFYSAIIDGKPSQNISAISAIGEGVAGLILQQIYKCRKLVRPYRDGVDIIMTDEEITYLVEAKGSANKKEEDFRDNKLNSEYLVEIITETLSSHAIDVRKVKGILIGVYLEDELNYNCYVTEIDIDQIFPGTLNTKLDINNEKFTVFKQTKTLINQICSVQILNELSKEKISPELEIQLEELVLIYVRNLSKNYKQEFSLDKLINQAIDKLLNSLNTQINEIGYENKIPIIKTYLERIKKSLKMKSGQRKSYSFIKKLEESISENLLQSRQFEDDSHKEFTFHKIYNKLLKMQKELMDQNILYVQEMRSNTNEEIDDAIINHPILKLTKIGFNSYIEGLLIYPDLDDLQDYVIKLNNLPDNFYTETNYFPIEVYYGDYGDYIFIIDDDGSIYVNTQNLTTDNFYKVGELLIQLAMALYNYPKN